MGGKQAAMRQPSSAGAWPMPPGKRMRYRDGKLQIRLGRGESCFALSRGELAMFGVDATLVAAFIRTSGKGRLILLFPLVLEVKRQLLMLSITAAFFAGIRSAQKRQPEIAEIMEEFASINGLTVDELLLRLKEGRAHELIRPDRPQVEATRFQRALGRASPLVFRGLLWPARMPRLTQTPA
jgi:hypothetical protein